MGGRAKTAATRARDLTAMDVGEALVMLRDDEKTKEFFAKIVALRAEIGKDVEVLGHADEIDRLLLRTRVDRNMAEEELVGAKAEAKKIRDGATEQLRKRERALEEATAVLAKNEALFKSEMAVREHKVTDREQMVEHRLSEANELMDRAVKRLNEATAMQAAQMEKAATLAEAIEAAR